MKPDFWTNSDLAIISREARLFCIAMFNHADDKGRFKADSWKRLKIASFPYDEDADELFIERCLNELCDIKMIRPYLVDGIRYFDFPNWHHQRIDKPQVSKLPPFREILVPFQEHSQTDSIVLDGIGEDRKGKDGPKAATPQYRLLEAFMEAFERHCGEPYAASKGKDLSLLAGLLKVFSEDALIYKMQLFFNKREDFLDRAGYTVGVFHSQINSLNDRPKAMQAKQPPAVNAFRVGMKMKQEFLEQKENGTLHD